MFIFPVELPQAGPLLCRGNLFTLEESECVEALLSSLMSCGALRLLGFSAFNEGPHFHCVCCCALSLSLSVCFSFLPHSHHSLPWGRSVLCILWQQLPLAITLGLRARWGLCPCSACLALPCAVSLTPGQVSWERSCSPGVISLPTLADSPTWGRA